MNSPNYSLVLAGSAPFAKPLLQSPVKPATDYLHPEAAAIAWHYEPRIRRSLKSGLEKARSAR